MTVALEFINNYITHIFLSLLEPRCWCHIQIPITPSGRSSSSTMLVGSSLGAVLVGGIVCAFLSGIVTMQVFLYYRLYPKDHNKFKTMVAIIWTIDLIHTIMASVSNWTYLISHYGDESMPDYVTWTIAVTVALTAFITWFVHCFFAWRIFTLSHSNYAIVVPIVVLALFRLAAALVSTSKMIQLQSFSRFVHGFGWVFTMGLSTAAAVDILIVVAMCWYLNRSRTGFTEMNTVIDSITLYTIENGLLTCVTTVVSLICWISMPHNLIFLGLHFAISKLYANAFLATLNARVVLRGRSQGSSADGDYPLPVLLSDRFGLASSRGGQSSQNEPEPATRKIQINVEKVIQHDVVEGGCQ
ncbi:hypothetical protein QCA50_010076 [Cerrena zonata]|uniref:DUF6534 domain-containing protein n=1 Tax=Cerrena zonata TaxID=2478898 RepID=A0AAW0G5P1_9APHY